MIIIIVSIDKFILNIYKKLILFFTLTKKVKKGKDRWTQKRY